MPWLWCTSLQTVLTPKSVQKHLQEQAAVSARKHLSYYQTIPMYDPSLHAGAHGCLDRQLCRWAPGALAPFRYLAQVFHVSHALQRKSFLHTVLQISHWWSLFKPSAGTAGMSAVGSFTSYCAGRRITTLTSWYVIFEDCFEQHVEITVTYGRVHLNMPCSPAHAFWSVL